MSTPIEDQTTRRRWAFEVLGISSAMPADKARRSLLSRVARCGFEPDSVTAEAIDTVAERRGNDDPAGECSSFRLHQESRHLSSVRRLELEFFFLAPSDRRHEWERLEPQLRDAPLARSRWKRLEAGLELPMEIPSDLPADVAATMLLERMRLVPRGWRDRLLRQALRSASEMRLQELAMAVAFLETDDSYRVHWLEDWLGDEAHRRKRTWHSGAGSFPDPLDDRVEERRGARFTEEFVEPEVLNPFDLAQRIETWFWRLVGLSLVLVVIVVIATWGDPPLPPPRFDHDFRPVPVHRRF